MLHADFDEREVPWEELIDPIRTELHSYVEDLTAA